MKSPSNFWRNGSAGRKFDSRFEGNVNASLEASGVPFALTNKDRAAALPYQRPVSHYHPDFTVMGPDGSVAFLVEAKGRFLSEDRTKLLLVKQQNPGTDIRLLFYRPTDKLSKSSATTYAGWCEKHGFPWAKGPNIPEEWINEVRKVADDMEKEDSHE